MPYIPIVEDAADFLDLLYIRPLYLAKVRATWNYRTFTVDVASTYSRDSCVRRPDRPLALIPYSRRPLQLLTSYLGVAVE